MPRNECGRIIDPFRTLIFAMKMNHKLKLT